MQGRISNIVPLVLITILSVITVEGAYQALEIFVLKPPAISKKQGDQKAEKVTAIKKSQETRADYRVILKRNLFGSTSKKNTPEIQATAPEPTAKNLESLGIVLMGTISGSDNNNRAIILMKESREQELFSKGEVIKGALIKEIQRGQLVLTIEGEDEILDMSEAAKMRPAFKAPPSTPVRKSAQPSSLGNRPVSSNIKAAATPRRRVVRRPRATQNTARPTRQQ